MATIAVIKSGGKQYKVKEGELLKVEKIEGEEGKKVKFDVLLVSDTQTGESNIGTPVLDKKYVEAEIVEQGRDPKIKVVKYKSKTRYHKVYGHRQPYTKVKILSIPS